MRNQSYKISILFFRQSQCNRNIKKIIILPDGKKPLIRSDKNYNYGGNIAKMVRDNSIAGFIASAGGLPTPTDGLQDVLVIAEAKNWGDLRGTSPDKLLQYTRTPQALYSKLKGSNKLTGFTDEIANHVVSSNPLRQAMYNSLNKDIFEAGVTITSIYGVTADRDITRDKFKSMAKGMSFWVQAERLFGREINLNALLTA